MVMNTCPCGHKLTFYRKIYKSLMSDHSWEEGLRCKKCGRLRVPSGKAVSYPPFHQTFTGPQLENLRDNLSKEEIDCTAFLARLMEA